MWFLNVNGDEHGSNRNLSVYTSDHIACAEYIYFDKRIKTDISIVNDNTALNQVNG